jgi:hypothetical protein
MTFKGSAHHPFSARSTDSGEKDVYSQKNIIHFAFTEAEDQHQNENIRRERYMISESMSLATIMTGRSESIT